MIIQPSCVPGAPVCNPYAPPLCADVSRMHGSLKEDIYVRRSVSAGYRLSALLNSGSAGTAKHIRTHVLTHTCTRTGAFDGTFLRGVIRQITIGIE